MMPEPMQQVGPEAVLGAAMTDTYAVLAVLLARAPKPGFLLQLRHAEWHPGLPEKLNRAYGGLRHAAGVYPHEAVEREFEALFVGLGAGEVVPYASWYRERTLMALPLARLRSDLNKMGIGRRIGVHEAEDHAALLCEAVALLRQQPRITPEAYARFIRDHVTSWMFDFFGDVYKAPSVGFYRSVACLGKCLLQLESIDSMPPHTPRKTLHE